MNLRRAAFSASGILALLLLALSACGPKPGLAGEEFLETPTVREAFADRAAPCDGVTPPRQPDLMAWDSSSRANLKSLQEQGVVAVRYESNGCEVSLDVLDCVGDEKYEFSPYSASETKIARNDRELRTELPLGSARLAARVGAGAGLRTDYLMVGVRRIPVRRAFDDEKLRGKCDRATHVVSKIFVGGFGMAAGRSDVLAGGASVFGLGGDVKRERETERLVEEGVRKACEAAQQSGDEEPRCSVPLRVSLTPIKGRAEGGCPLHSYWDGARCVREAKVTPCPDGMLRIEGQCQPPISTSCPPDMVFVEGQGCRVVPVTPAPVAVAPAPSSVPLEPPLPPTLEGPCSLEMVFLPAARITIGSDKGGEDERPTHEVDIGPLCIDRYEVTEADHDACLQSRKCERTKRPCTGKDKKEPIRCLTWSDALAYCTAQGKRLPTEFEWEYAARGRTGRTFPWGDALPTGERLNACGTECQSDPLYPEPDGWPGPAPVGSFPAGSTPEGVLDLAGNAWEWTASPYCRYPSGTCDRTRRVVRGGHYRSQLLGRITSSARFALLKDAKNPFVGFRCARTGQEAAEDE